jgi:hypothetical protein
MKPTLFAGDALSAMLTFCSLAYGDILIGIGAPFSGDYSAFGAQILKGADPITHPIHCAEGALCVGIAQIGGKQIPFERFCLVYRCAGRDETGHSYVIEITL